MHPLASLLVLQDTETFPAQETGWFYLTDVEP